MSFFITLGSQYCNDQKVLMILSSYEFLFIILHFIVGTFLGRTRSNERLQTNLFDSDDETSPGTQTREARYGRRSSQSNDDQTGGRVGSGTTRHMRPTSDYSDMSDRFQSSSSSGQRNRYVYCTAKEI